ncbi:MAG: hypothetical protein LM590_01740 [Thermofilum sp.]|nr:hypothetical protein [Thermofilum sp.]
MAWASVRYGSLRIYLSTLNLNEKGPSLRWYIRAKSWVQQWPGKEGKRLAKRVAEQHPLGHLARYLGDGERHSHNLRFAVGNSDEVKPKTLVPEMLRAAYDVGYGVLLDPLDSDRWLTLENLQPKRDPVHATFQGCAFWINYYKGNRTLQACALFKDPEEASRIARALAKLGVEARMHPWKTGYYALELSGRYVLKMAELCPEWRRALGELAQKRNMQPKTPMLRRLLELAENPPASQN